MSPHDARVMYACLSQAAFSTEGSLYRSADLGHTWQRFDRGIRAESTMMAVAVHPHDPARVYCIARGGQVFGTEDSGDSWKEYRLPAGRSQVPLLDAQRAIRTVRANAKAWSLDPAHIGIMGFSAGGHLASTAGTHFDAGEPD